MIPNKIGNFKRYIGSPSTMKYGYYYQTVFTLPFSKENKRMVRVWLPEDYDFANSDNRYPVIYMSDGQNLVDRYLSAYGEWELDKTVHQLQKEGFKGCIAVGIDCPKTDPLERIKELCPPYPPKELMFKKYGVEFTSYADKYVDFIINELKPIIDKLFFTLPDQDHTAIGGSSMGGIMAFFAFMYRRDIFGFSLSFSPAFFFYKKKDWFGIIDKHQVNPVDNHKLYLYVGGKNFEKRFVRPTVYTYEYLLKKGFDNNHLVLKTDENEIHHEKAWAKYLPDALRFWLK